MTIWIALLIGLTCLTAGLAAPSLVNRWLEGVPETDDESEDEEFAEFHAGRP